MISSTECCSYLSTYAERVIFNYDIHIMIIFASTWLTLHLFHIQSKICLLKGHMGNKCTIGEHHMDFLQVFGSTDLCREQSRKATLPPNTIYDDRTTEWKLNNNKPINNWINELTQIFKPNSGNEYIQTITIGKQGIDSLALATKKCCSCF